MQENNNNNNTESVAKKAISFGVAATKVFTGTATPADWKVFLKYAIPIAFGGVFLSLIIFVFIIGLVFGPAYTAKEAIKNTGSSIWNFLRYGNTSGPEAAFFDRLKNSGLDCKKTSLVTETLYYYYQNYDKEIDLGTEEDEDEREIEQTTTDPETGEETTETVVEEINYGKLLPDEKRLIKQIKKGDSEYEEYVKNKFLEKKPYNELLEGYEDVDKRKDEIYENIKAIAENIPCEEQRSLSGACSFSTGGNIVSNLKVRLLQCNAPYNPIPNEELVDFEKYITGVVRQEVGNLSYETFKAQAVAARSFALVRSKNVGAGIGKTYQENGQWIIDLRACTGDQAYCDPDKGCWSLNLGGEMNLGPDGTMHSGYDSSKPWSLPALPEDSPIRQAVKETEGMVALNSNGEIVNTDFLDSDQNAWERNVKSGMDYQEALKTHYSEIASVASNCQSTGQIRLPLDEGSYTITSGYGGRNSPGGIGSTNHKGVDMGANMGTPIYAVAPGTVELAGWYGGYGNAVILGHDTDNDGENDTFTLYGHQSELLVTTGQTVVGGQQIGKVGSTGNSTGPHLHFEVRRGGNTFNSASPENPIPHLDAIKAGTSIFKDMVKSQEKYYNQADYANIQYCPGMNSNMQQSGCAPVAFAMVVAYLKDSNITPVNIADDICTNYSSYRVRGGGTSSALLSDTSFLSKYHIKSTHITSNYENEIKNALKASKIIIVNVKSGIFNPSGAGHFFVLVSSGKDGTVKVLDPGSRERTKEWNISSITSNISDGIWIFE